MEHISTKTEILELEMMVCSVGFQLCRGQFSYLLGDLIQYFILQVSIEKGNGDDFFCQVYQKWWRRTTLTASDTVLFTLLKVVSTWNILRSLVAVVESDGDWNQYLM